jgi:hypothetical protein
VELSAWGVPIQNNNIKGVACMKCFTCSYLHINLSDKDDVPVENYRYKKCFSKCIYLDKPLSFLTEEDLNKCHYRKRKS